MAEVDFIPVDGLWKAPRPQHVGAPISPEEPELSVPRRLQPISIATALMPSARSVEFGGAKRWLSDGTGPLWQTHNETVAPATPTRATAPLHVHIGLVRAYLTRACRLLSSRSVSVSALNTQHLSTLLNHGSFLPGSGTPGLVSVVIPCYNRAHIVRETIDSVLAQTYGNFEALVIDDGSTDSTRSVVARYTDPRVRYFYRQNGGLSAARNSGLDAARGEFIAFLDSDDLWHPWKLAAQVEIFRRHPEAGLIWSDMSTFTNTGEILSERHLRTYYSAYNSLDFERRPGRAGTLSELLTDAPLDLAGSPYFVADIFQDMFSGNLVHPPTAIVRRERLQQSGPFEPEVTGLGAEDYHFYFRISSHGPVAFLDAPTTLYRVHPTQMSTCNRLHEARGNLNVLLHWLQRHPPALPQARINERLAKSHAWLGAEELYAGNSRDATRHLWQSLRLHSEQPATAALLMISLLPQRVAHVLRGWKRAVHGVVRRRVLGVVLLVTHDHDLLYVLISLLQPEFAGI